MVLVLALFASLSAEWVLVRPSGPAPDFQRPSQMVFDTSANRYVFLDLGFDPAPEVWTLDSTASQWRKVPPSDPRPTRRTSASAVWDSSSSSAIISGGCGTPPWCVHISGEAWTFTGLAWTRLQASGPLRANHSTVFDASSRRMIVFGGCSADLYGCGEFNNEVWIMSMRGDSAADWLHLAPEGDPPCPRRGQTAVYDAGSNRMIVFGGDCREGRLMNDLWVLTNANGLGGPSRWLPLTPAGPRPRARHDHVAFYQQSGNRMIVLTGQGVGAVALTDLWSLEHANGLAGTPQWAQVKAGGRPPSARIRVAAACNADCSEILVAGGSDSHGLPTGGLWKLRVE